VTSLSAATARRGQPHREATSWRTILVLAVAIVLGIVLRFPSLGAKPLWFDEAVLWLVSSRHSLSGVISANASINSAPPLFALLLHTMMPGRTEAILRTLPAIFGVAAIPAMYGLSRTLNPSRLAALLAAFLIAALPTQIEYSQQVREYSLAILLTTLTWLITARLVVCPARRWVLAFTVVLTLDILSQYGLWFIVVIPIALSLRVAYRSGLLSLLLAAGLLPLTAVVWVLWTTAPAQIRLQNAVNATYLSSGYPSGRSLTAVIHFAALNLVHLVWFSLFYNGRISGVLVVLLAVAGVGVALRLPRGGTIALLLLGSFVLIFLASLGGKYPFIPARQDIMLTVPLVLLAAWSSAFLFARGAVPGCAATVLRVLGGMVVLYGTIEIATADRAYFHWGGLERITSSMAALERSLQPHDRVYVQYNAIPMFLYYWCRGHNCGAGFNQGAGAFLHWHLRRSTEADAVVLGAPSRDVRAHPFAPRFLPSDLETLTRTSRRVWIVFADTRPPDQQGILRTLRCAGTVRRKISDVRASLYVWEPARHPTFPHGVCGLAR
jgi:hypothetical protein